MAWQKIGERSVSPMCNRGSAPLEWGRLEEWLVDQADKTGTRLRVIVEADLTECCCDRWRGKRARTSEVFTFRGVEWREALCSFCPECGRKL